MPQVAFSPPFTRHADAVRQLIDTGYVVMAPMDVAACIGCDISDLQPLNASWDNLPPDEFLKDGGRYRRRRHACFVVKSQHVQPVERRAHWQPIEYNALHGGMERWFAPMEPALVARPVWQQLLSGLAVLSDAVFTSSSPSSDAVPWFVEAHQFRIDTTDGIGRPTPEGAHRDGVDLVAVFLIGREGIKGGETRVFEASGPQGQRFTLSEPWSLLLLDDARMIHESTPIQPLASGGHRDTLVITYRRGGFQGADAVISTSP